MHGVDRPIQERSKAEIEKKLSGLGDYVKMSYLQRALKSGLDFDTKKFVLLKLAGIYEQKGMLLEAARMTRNAAEINATFKDKINDYMKTVELHIRGLNYQEADIVFPQALALANSAEKRELKVKLKDIYLAHAKTLANSGKRQNAKKAYEKALTLDLSPNEKKEIQEQLLGLYDSLGNVREYLNLKKGV